MGAAASNPALGAPFYLTLSTSNTTYNGTLLDWCTPDNTVHALCARGNTPQGASPTNTFQFQNVSTSDSGYGRTGYVTYTRSTANGDVSEPLNLLYAADSNVAFANFSAPSNFYVSFRSDNTLLLPDIYDDTRPPLAPGFSVVTPYYRWVICDTTYHGGNTPTLNWVLGKYPAENPSCQTVTVKRQYV